jgi:hypothetical protein
MTPASILAQIETWLTQRGKHVFERSVLRMEAVFQSNLPMVAAIVREAGLTSE